jgi:phospholipid/cholesterol/gamma-HCH transport system permease protein
VRYVPSALTRYRKETTRLIAEMTLGAGALVVIGGTVGVAAFLMLASGGILAVQVHSSLGNVGIEALTGFLSAFLNVRVVAPVVAGIALAATIGAGATAQLGAMRVPEEIDAVESMAVHSVSYLVSTRLIAGLVAIVPLYSLSVPGVSGVDREVAEHDQGLCPQFEGLVPVSGWSRPWLAVGDAGGCRGIRGVAAAAAAGS